MIVYLFYLYIVVGTHEVINLGMSLTILIGESRGGGTRDVPSGGSKFVHFHAVFVTKYASTPTLGVGAHSGKSWIRHCILATLYQG